jgi:hypothetical protein
MATHVEERATTEAVPRAVDPDGRHRVDFPELVWAHFLWQKEVHEHGILHGEAEQEYLETLAAFEHAHGRLVKAHWCTREASAVAITEWRPPFVGDLLRLHPTVALHSATHWVTHDLPEIAALLHRCETMAIKFTEILRHSSQQVAMHWVLSIAGDLLGFADQSEPPSKAEVEKFVAGKEKELKALQAYYKQAGEETGRIVYFWGMMIGVGVLAVIGAAWALLLDGFDVNWDDPDTRNLYAAYTMGAVGAVVSVLSRMSSIGRNKFGIDFEVGRPPLRRLGSFRPLIGAVFALVLYLALRGGLVQPGGEPTDSLEFYAVMSFFAGFSERWARVVLAPARGLLGSDEEPPAPAPGADTGATSPNGRERKRPN